MEDSTEEAATVVTSPDPIVRDAMQNQDDAVDDESTPKIHPESTPASPSDDEKGTSSQLPTSTLIRTKNGYVPRQRPQYKNNILIAVGFLELTNALDFAANIWNQIPTPLFAQVLMGLGGSIAILWTAFAFWDLHRSLRNIKILRTERRLLQNWQNSFQQHDSFDTRCLVQAWLDVNFRELGWECIDRVGLDLFSGMSGILVGTGAIMAIRGDDPKVFLASNLLSGYIGNSFLAPFALANSIWSVFMWRRAGGEHERVVKGEFAVVPDLRSRMKAHGRRHRFYAVLNGCTAVVGAVGSIMSSTLWYGYVLIAPCVLTTIICVVFWRTKQGYDRLPVMEKADLEGLDILARLETIIAVQAAVETNTLAHLQEGISANIKSARMLDLMAQLGLYDEYCCQLLRNEHIAQKILDGRPEMVTLDPRTILALHKTTLVDTARAVIAGPPSHTLQYQERFLIEVYGRYIKALECSVDR